MPMGRKTWCDSSGESAPSTIDGLPPSALQSAAALSSESQGTPSLPSWAEPSPTGLFSGRQTSESAADADDTMPGTPPCEPQDVDRVEDVPTPQPPALDEAASRAADERRAMSETDEHEAMENEATEAHESLSAGASAQTLEHAIPGQATAESARADPDSEWVPSQETNEEQPSEEVSLVHAE